MAKIKIKHNKTLSTFYRKPIFWIETSVVSMDNYEVSIS